MRNPFVDSWGGPSALSVCLIVSAFILAVIVGVFALSITIERHYGHIHCKAFGHNTNRTTKFVVQSYVDGGVCLTPSSDGRWIPTSQLRDIR